MYFLNNFCCICMNKSHLKHIFDVDSDGVSHYNKLTSSIAEMNFKEMNDQRLICGECCVTLNTVYNFRQMCLRSKTNLITYISQLQMSSHVSGILSVRLTDIKYEIEVVKEEICNKYKNNEGSSSFEESNPLSGFKTDSYEESIQFPASVKEESEDSSAHEDATVDHVNEGAHSDVRVKVEHQTMMEDELYILHSEIDIAEDPLAVVKEEPMTNSETPQDGSTSSRQRNCVIGEKSYYWDQRQEHIRIHSNIKRYSCDICKKDFAYMSDLSRHKRIHTGEKPYVCEICNKNFNHKGNLRNHLRIHYDERPHECEICKKGFTVNSHLTAHMMVHSNETPYECEICKKKFNFKCRLTNHMLLHSDERPHVCHICQKRFKVKSRLSKHMRIHSGERPYECEICKKSFTFSNTLTKHMAVHSNETPYDCEICKTKFKLKGVLTRHMKNVHERF